MEEKNKIKNIDEIEEKEEANARAIQNEEKEDVNEEDNKTNVNSANEIDNQKSNNTEKSEAIKKEIYAIFDKKSGNSVKITAEIDKDKSIEENKSELDKLLDELIERKDIKSLSIDFNINNETKTFTTNEKLGLSVSDAVNKIKEAVKDFEDIVIVYSKEELELLQKQYREEHGLTDDKGNEVSADENEKSYEDRKKDFSNQVEADEDLAKGYIRISKKDYEKLGNILDENKIPYVANESERKTGINITAPINEMDKLKAVLQSKHIKLLQIVHGNINWQSIKKTKNVCEEVTKEEFEKFKEQNNNQFKYIAFEGEKDFTVYMDEKCDIKIHQNSSKQKQNSNKKPSNGKKTLAEVKKTVDEVKQNESNVKNIEKIKDEKER